jgi:hypothetical protein
MPKGRSEEEVMGGFPSEGDPHDNTPPAKPARRAAEPSGEDAEDDRLARLEKQLADVQRENETLRRVQEASVRPAAPPVTQEERDETDWEDLMFRDPKKFAEQIEERAYKRARHDLTTEYQRDQGTQSFWRDFYERHPDLKDDRDLVETTLKSNMRALADKPSGVAADELADLTRKRIIRYTGANTKGKDKEKARVEGAGNPTPRRSRVYDDQGDDDDTDETKSQRGDDKSYAKIGDLIKERRKNRARAA